MRGVRAIVGWLAAALAVLPAPAALPTTAPLPLDERALAAAAFGNDAAWYEENIPFFEASDARLQQVWYYRWAVFRAHQRDLGRQGFITTEFLNDVGWQREPYASLNDASGFHIADGRWLRDRRYVGDYVDFLYAGGGNDRHFSEAIADATYGRYLADGDRSAALAHLDAMKHVFALWDDHLDFDRGLYWVEPLLDATEYTIASIDASGGQDGFTGGHAFRPSINSYMYANARAIARLAALSGDTATAADYDRRADAIRLRVRRDLWSPALGHFVDRYRIDNRFVHYWQPIRGREMVGYLPWTFGLAADDGTSAAAWRHLLSPAELGGAAGPRTVEPSYQYYMRQYRYDAATGARECQWNGPSWPFQTTQALTGLARLLHDYHQSIATRSDYLRLLRQYAALHYQGDRLDIEEDYDPDTGRPIVGLARSHHYEHSGFADLIVTGLAGLRPRADDVLEVDPLVPDAGDLRWFALQDLPYHGHLVTILWDADGSRYGRRRGLSVLVDGVAAGHADHATRLLLPLARRAAPVPRRPIDLAVNLVRSAYPRGSASINARPEALHQALDGRVWFFPEASNGWSTDGSRGGDEWFAVDLGEPAQVSQAELAFYADDTHYAAPAAARLQAWQRGGWRDLGPPVRPLANGVTRLQWAPVATPRVRLVLRNQPGRAARLVELKLF